MKNLLLLALSLSFSISAMAQNATAVKFAGKKEKLTRVSFEGLSLNIPVDVMIEKAGLKIGQLIDENDKQKALFNLLNTFLFTNIDIDSVSLNGDVKLTFIVQQVPDEWGKCSFRHFDGINDSEILESIKEALPNYDGKITRSVFVLGIVKKTLKNLIVKKQIAGDIKEMLMQDSMTGKPIFVFELINI